MQGLGRATVAKEREVGNTGGEGRAVVEGTGPSSRWQKAGVSGIYGHKATSVPWQRHRQAGGRAGRHTQCGSNKCVCR